MQKSVTNVQKSVTTEEPIKFEILENGNGNILIKTNKNDGCNSQAREFFNNASCTCSSCGLEQFWRHWKTHSCILPFSNCIRNHVFTYTNCTSRDRCFDTFIWLPLFQWSQTIGGGGRDDHIDNTFALISHKSNQTEVHTLNRDSSAINIKILASKQQNPSYYLNLYQHLASPTLHYDCRKMY